MSETVDKDVPFQFQGRELGGNSGHGHVWERPDKTKARCGGVAICGQCAKDKVLWDLAVKHLGR